MKKRKIDAMVSVPMDGEADWRKRKPSARRILLTNQLDPKMNGVYRWKKTHQAGGVSMMEMVRVKP